jgi:LPS export ABC transporter protein LptC
MFYTYIKYLKNIALQLVLVSCAALLMLSSCENKIDVVNKITNDKEYPVMAATNYEIIYSDSGLVKLRLTSTDVKRFLNSNQPYIEFPKGIKVEFLTPTLQTAALITANYAKYDERKKLWYAKGNVICRSLVKNEQLLSEEMYWDEQSGRIYSHKFTRVINEDGNVVGEGGFESDQSLTKWKLLGSKGTMNVHE